MTQPPSRDPRQPFGQRPSNGRDPRQPFGQPAPTPGSEPHPGQPQAPTSLPPELAAPPRSRLPLLLSLLALAIVGGLLWGVARMGSGPEPQTTRPAPTASIPTEGATAADPTPGRAPATGNLRSIPFANAEEASAGTFEILRDEWTSEGLVLTIRVSLTQGQQRLDFFALDNGPTARQYDPSSTGNDYLAGQPIRAGQTLTGRVLFEKERGDTTIFLAGTHGRQVAALKVEG